MRAAGLTDDSVDVLARMPKLALLDLSGNAVLTDGSLERLAKVRTLRYLIVSYCRHLTASGIKAFKKARPDIDVDVEQEQGLAVDQLHWEGLDTDGQSGRPK